MKKTVSFAAVHMSVAFGVGYTMTGDVIVGGTLALVEPMVNTIAYYFHEMAWTNNRREKEDARLTSMSVVR